MSLLGLADYGSGSDSDGDDNAPPGAMPPPPAPKPSGGGLLGKLPAPSGGGSAGLLGKLPAPSGGGSAGLLGKLPAPSGGGGKGKKVAWKPPVKLKQLAEEEEEAPKKKLKFSNTPMSLKDLLPKPKNIDLGGGLEGGLGGRLDLGGGDAGTGGSKGAAAKVEAAAPAPAPTPDQVSVPEGQKDAFSAFRVEYSELAGGERAAPVEGSAEHAAAWAAYYAQQGGGQDNAAAWAHYYAQQGASDPMYSNYYNQQAAGEGEEGAAGPAGPAPSGDMLMHAALAADQQRDKKRRKNARDDPFAALAAMDVKEIKQSDLTFKGHYMGAELNPTGAAFSQEDRQKLVDAAGAKPSQQHRQKHQMLALYHDAKLREIELMENRVKALKTKGETQAKYGW